MCILFPTLSSFVDMDREEMEYVDGGSWFPYGWAVSVGIDNK